MLDGIRDGLLLDEWLYEAILLQYAEATPDPDRPNQKLLLSAEYKPSFYEALHPEVKAICGSESSRATITKMWWWTKCPLPKSHLSSASFLALKVFQYGKEIGTKTFVLEKLRKI